MSNKTQSKSNAKTRVKSTTLATKAKVPARKAASPASAKLPALKAAPVKAASVKAAATVPAKGLVSAPPPAPVAKPAASQTAPKADNKKSAKVKKVKLVRDSFTMPEPDYALLAALKKRCLGQGVVAKKGELLRAAVQTLASMDDKALLAAFRKVETLKTGRPKKAK